MDKLTIEEKAKRYDEVIERVVNIRTGKCETTFIFTEGLFNYLFPELEECNEEEVRKAMIDFFKHEREEGVVVSHYGVNIERMIAWLEKQGEQKPTDKVVPKFKVGDWITNGATKPAQISSIEDDMYYTHNGTIGCDIESVDKDSHLWNIADVRDGDVLYSPCLSLLWIFKSIDTVYCGCNLNYNDGAFCGEGYIERPTDAIPATKEQRDTLFAKMKEAGYEWDAEKKELKKISQRMISAEAKEAMYGNPAWSEEDELKRSTLIHVVKKLQGSAIFEGLLPEELIDWLKSLSKERRMKP